MEEGSRHVLSLQFKYTLTIMFWFRTCQRQKCHQDNLSSYQEWFCGGRWVSLLTFPLQPVFALAVEQQLVVDIWQQELDTPALHTQLVLHQHNGTAIVAGLWTRDHTDLITEGADTESEGWGKFSFIVYGHGITLLTTNKIPYAQKPRQLIWGNQSMFIFQMKII